MATVDIYLPIESTAEWIHALWLRFATFTICSAKGHLSTTEGGQTVDYENVSFNNIADRYYYAPDNNVYHLVDYNAFDDKCTSSAATPRCYDFREKICTRDDECVITGAERDDCDAAHIIPGRKGSDDVDIDCIENGMLLSTHIHVKFGLAKIVFLKTPNFAMVPVDVPRVEQGSIPDNRTTLQYMVEPTTELDFVRMRDVRADWREKVRPPPSILLDFMYGAAVVKHWKCDCLRDMLEKRLKRSDPESKVGPDGPKDSDREPLRGKQKGRKTFSSDASAGLLKAMDDVLLLSMLLKGTTPQSIAAQRERRHKEEELRCQEQSREKVQQWLNLSATPLNNVEKDC
ncbi:hypothetical protein EV363DRAFT_1542522 [Boletus edulis]|nr:hypothetical protein EV363DRAFT_1542522 [Boletus edulis]